ncbi:MAG TPA: DNA/RNA nuclease SfsA [Anaerovoracaceae bacterium]|nr:DNA/RNA nuclease SfsA [Anaerovoracaceae bacterium]
MKYQDIKEAIFLSRPNRFVARAVIGGDKHTVHVKNTGRCRELLLEGARIFLEDRGDIRNNRKTRYSMIAVEKEDGRAESGIRLVNIDSLAPNRVVREGLAAASLVLPGLEFPLIRIKPETTFGSSRFDFYVEDRKGTKAFIEVKGVTLEDDGVARFPDAPTERGARHVRELCRALDSGFAAYIIFVIQMRGVAHFEPNDETHPAFGEALREAYDRGVVILAYDCDVSPDGMALGEPVPIKLHPAT